METSTIFATVIFTGLTCSMGCGTVNTPFILGSLLGDGKSISEGRRAIMLFSIGKVLSLMLMGLLASIFGMIVLDYVEGIYPEATIWIIRIVTFGFGAKILYTTVKDDFIPKKVEQDASSCSTGCSGCSKAKSCSSVTNVKIKGSSNLSYIVAGLLYATIPCGPMLACLTYASTMNVVVAMTLLGVFGVVNSIVPIFFFASLVGLANNEFSKNSENFLKYIKLTGGIVLIYASIFQVY